MLDIKLIREDSATVKKNLERRNNPDFVKMLSSLLKADGEWRELLSEAGALRESRNKVSLQIAEAKKKGGSTKALQAKASKIPAKIQKVEEMKADAEARMKASLLRLPNLLDKSVPDGDAVASKVVKVSGRQPKFDFKPRDHLEILRDLGMIDAERGAKVAGHGFYYLKGDAVVLDMALMRFAVDFLRRRDFILVEPPLMMNFDSMMGAEDMADFQDQIYKIADEDLFLIGTSEHPIAAMFKGDVLEDGDLPVHVAGVSPCFRKEVGSHGKYTKVAEHSIRIMGRSATFYMVGLYYF